MANEKLNNTLAPNRILRELEKKADKASAYVLPVATNAVLGGIKVTGNGLAVSEAGILSLTEEATIPYVLPASAVDALGGVMVNGNGLAVDEDGLLTLTPATVEANGAMSKEDKVLIATLVSDLAALTLRVEALEDETP